MFRVQGEKEMMKANTLEWYRHNYNGFMDHLRIIKPWIDGKNVLDIGSGEGNSLLVMQQVAKSVRGIDPWFWMDDEKMKIWKEHCKRVSQPHNIAMFPMAIGEGQRSLAMFHGKMDVVTSFATFEHLKNPRLAVQEITKILKPGGTFIMFSSPLYYSRRGGHLYHFFDTEGAWEHLRYSAKEIRQEYELEGGIEKDGGYYWELYKTLNGMTVNEFKAYVEPFFYEEMCKVSTDITNDFRSFPELAKKYPENLLRETGIKWIGKLR